MLCHGGSNRMLARLLHTAGRKLAMRSATAIRERGLVDVAIVRVCAAGSAEAALASVLGHFRRCGADPVAGMAMCLQNLIAELTLAPTTLLRTQPLPPCDGGF